MHLHEHVHEVVQELAARANVVDLPLDGSKWAMIRRAYAHQTPQIMAREGDKYSVDPYFLDWPSIFTPIEQAAWSDIRSSGIPLYPQYPVANVFVDFGDPVKQIALECDGKAYHNQDDDAARDSRLFDLGWTVFRVTGSECKRLEFDMGSLLSDLNNDLIDEERFSYYAYQWATKSSEGVLAAIGSHYYAKDRHPLIERHFPESLRSHSYFFGL